MKNRKSQTSMTRHNARTEAREQKAFDEQTERIATNPASQSNIRRAYERNKRKLLG